jgi:two-component system chemotaxis sensor kinase CheA
VPATATVPVVDDSYGFFEDLPDMVPEAAAPAGSDDDAGFGLFDDAPGAPEAPDAPEAEVPAIAPGDSPAAIEGPGYGIYVDAPGGLGLFDDAPGAERVISNSAPEPFSSKAAGALAAGEATQTAAAIRVDVDKVDQLINLVGELVITQAMLAQSASVLDPVEFERLHNGWRSSNAIRATCRNR